MKIQIKTPWKKSLGKIFTRKFFQKRLFRRLPSVEFCLFYVSLEYFLDSSRFQPLPLGVFMARMKTVFEANWKITYFKLVTVEYWQFRRAVETKQYECCMLWIPFWIIKCRKLKLCLCWLWFEFRMNFTFFKNLQSLQLMMFCHYVVFLNPSKYSRSFL